MLKDICKIYVKMIISTKNCIKFSGHEIDFLTLLRSFGLDMTSVARALGVDIQTLNNMDRDILLHLLTSQQTTN